MGTKALNVTRRVLPAEPFASLDDYIRTGGGEGLRAARLVEPEVVIAELEASGLRGRGGAGFPTGRKWRTIAEFSSDVLRTAVVVNAAEGEPGTFKDRAIIAANPYAVIEGALIAARVFGAPTVTIATKERFSDIVTRLRSAIAEVRGAGWDEGVEIDVVEGPGEYLYGEETALLEVLAGRPPFPRIAPPWRRGTVEVVTDTEAAESGSGLAADVRLATHADGNVPPPVLVNNVETFANIPAIVARGADWFRSVGTKESPGTIVCTVTGALRPTVVEVAMGTRLADVIDASAADDQPVDPAIVLMGVSGSVLTADELDVGLSHEAMAARGTQLGSAGFIVYDRSSDPVAIAAGASRFLAVESCGQCTPCKSDGLQISGLLDQLVAGTAGADAVDTIEHRLSTITEGARCNLAAQHQAVVSSLLARCAPALRSRPPTGHGSAGADHRRRARPRRRRARRPRPVVRGKQPDWTDDAVDSGTYPVERLTDHRAGEESEPS